VTETRAVTPVPTHPETVAGDPRALRWMVPAGLVPTGRVRRAPDELGRLFADGTLTAGLVGHVSVWLWLRPGSSWRDEGPRVRSALQRALAVPTGWLVEPAADEVLARVSNELLDGSVGDYVRSHGGAVEVSAVTDGTVELRFGGVCAECPALGLTMQRRVERALRSRWPDVVDVRATRQKRA
jgi:Fe/S biogenesis protein NfuA